MRRFAYVDVLRGLAILVVLVHHLPDPMGQIFGRLATFGGRGVDLFFVLSGFLIGTTSLSRASAAVSSGTQAKAYWLLRTLRIWPVYFLLLGIYALSLKTFDPEVGKVLRHAWGYFLTFTSNDLGQGTLELGVLWSLAIEEQFYLAVGLIVLATARRRETLAAAFVGMAAAAIAVALRTRYELFSVTRHYLPQGTYVFRLYFSTLTRIDQLALGIMAAVCAPRLNTLRWASSDRAARATTWLAVGGVVALLLFLPTHPVIEFFVLGIAFAAAVLWAQRPAARALSVHALERPIFAIMANAGKLSFGLYMFHPFVRHWCVAVLERLGWSGGRYAGVVLLAIWVPATWAIAWVSYRHIEEPLLEWGRKRVSAMLAREQETKLAA